MDKQAKEMAENNEETVTSKATSDESDLPRGLLRNH